jgi:transcriptional regulator with XRE-family HTH domain
MTELTLREWRIKRGLRQEDLAAEAGLDQATVSNIERDPQANPRIDTVDSLCEVLKITRSQLKLGAAVTAKRHGRRPVGAGL